jgi:hypothetical protein
VTTTLDLELPNSLAPRKGKVDLVVSLWKDGERLEEEVIRNVSFPKIKR